MATPLGDLLDMGLPHQVGNSANKINSVPLGSKLLHAKLPAPFLTWNKILWNLRTKDYKM